MKQKQSTSQEEKKDKHKRITVKKCEVVQQVKYLSEEKIREVLETKNCIKKWAYILHDKDVYTEEDEKEDATHKTGTLKEAHWHICISFKDSTEIKTIANWFQIEQQYVNKSHSGYFEDMALYLTHKNACEKYQYEAEEVKANFNYVKFLEKGKIQSRIEEITEMIIAGEIREYNYTSYITPPEYQLYKSSIDKAYEYRRDKMYSGNRSLDVIYITGASGLGKTVLAKHIAEQKGYSYFVSGSDNDPLDGYKGQDCLILDDIRGSSMKFSNFIKILDNNTDSKVQSRYYNKTLTECKLIIITSIHSIEKFYENVFSEQDEPLVQFKRRCKTLLEIENESFYYAYSFSKDNDEYALAGRFKNPAREYILQTRENVKSYDEMAEFLSAEKYGVFSLDLEKHYPEIDDEELHVSISATKKEVIEWYKNNPQKQ